MKELYKIAVTVPESHADAVREAIGKTGAGHLGNYSFCSFSSKGIGRFKPEAGANPTIGEIGQFEEVIEEHVEVTCPKDLLEDTISAIRSAHPYEEPVIDVYVMWASI